MLARISLVFFHYFRTLSSDSHNFSIFFRKYLQELLSKFLQQIGIPPGNLLKSFVIIFSKFFNFYGNFSRRCPEDCPNICLTISLGIPMKIPLKLSMKIAPDFFFINPEISLKISPGLLTSIIFAGNFHIFFFWK